MCGYEVQMYIKFLSPSSSHSYFLYTYQTLQKIFLSLTMLFKAKQQYKDTLKVLPVLCNIKFM